MTVLRRASHGEGIKDCNFMQFIIVGYFLHACLLVYIFMLVCLNSMDATLICVFWFLFLAIVQFPQYCFNSLLSVVIITFNVYTLFIFQYMHRGPQTFYNE